MQFIAIVSGKGGVGKSTFTSLLAARLSKYHRVLLLDFDLTGPSNIFGVEGKIIRTKNGLKPLSVSENLHFLSMSALVKKEDAVIWRTPKKLQLLEMFYNSAYELTNEGTESYDFVLIDTPPGISIVHKFLKMKGVRPLLITTSQNVALNDSINTIYFFQDGTEESGLDFYGIIENMSGIKCHKCQKVNNIFSRNGGKLLAEEFNLPFLGTIQIETNLADSVENGTVLADMDTFTFIDTLDNVIESFKKKD